MTHNSVQPTTSISQLYPSYGAQWQGYDLHQGGYGESQMFPRQQFPAQGLTSPGAPRVSPRLLGNNQVNRATSSTSTPPPGRFSGTPGRPPISLLMTRFLLPAEPWKTDVARIVDLPPLPEISYDNYYADDESDNLSDLGGAVGKPSVSLKQTEFSWKQFAKRMGQANYGAFNKWNKVWWLGF